MQTKIVLRQKTRLAEDRLSLDLASSLNADSCADRARVRLCAREAKLNPRVGGLSEREFISQKRGNLPHIHHQYIDVAVVVEITECRSPARLQIERAGSDICAHIF